MTPNDPLEILKTLKSLALTKNEKQAVRAELVRHMRPMPRISFAILLARPLAAALVIILLVSGSVALAAETSLPGDFLYPVKTDINERVQGALMARFGSGIDWQMSRAERRLEEAEQLLSEGRLTAEAIAQIQNRFEASTSLAEQSIESDSDSEDDKANREGSFEARLRAHEYILSRLSAKHQEEVNNTEQKIDILIEQVRVRTSAAAEKRNNTELKFSDRAEAELTASASAQKQLAEAKLGQARTQLQHISLQISEQTNAETATKLTQAAELITAGQAKFDARLYGEALALFSQSYRVSQEVETVLQATIKFQFDLGSQVRGQNTNKEKKNETPGNNSQNKGLFDQLRLPLHLGD